MIDVNHFREMIIAPTLDHLGLYSKAAENLLVGTAIQESHLTSLKQIGGGPGLGFYQMEPATHKDIWDNYLRYRHKLRDRVLSLLAPWPKKERQLYSSRFYAAAMTRVHYRRVKEKLPDADDIPGLARYWKRYYNTHKGKGTTEEFTANYRKYA